MKLKKLEIYLKIRENQYRTGIKFLHIWWNQRAIFTIDYVVKTKRLRVVRPYHGVLLDIWL